MGMHVVLIGADITVGPFKTAADALKWAQARLLDTGIEWAIVTLLSPATATKQIEEFGIG